MKNILIVEDDRFYAGQMIRTLMRHYPGLVIDSCENANELFERLGKKEVHYDLIIADLLLPDSEGEHIGKLVDAGEAVVVVTGNTDIGYKRKIFELDIVDYIIKSENERFEYLLKLLERLQRNRGKKILIVDDSPTVRAFFQKMLRRQQLHVLEAENGQEGLKLVNAEHVDMVISDYMMPVMDGLSLLVEIRKEMSMLDLPFIAVSTHENEGVVANFLRHGANDFLKKPFGKEELMWRINNTLDLVDMLQKEREHAVKDELTTLYNRYYLDEIAPKMLAFAERYEEQPLSLMILDVDHFKRINDTYGHLVGDKVLKSVSDIIKKEVRKSDVVIRFGGEEFLVLMPSTDVRRAFVAGEKLRRDIEKNSVELGNGKVIPVTVSGGVVQCKRGLSLDDLIRCADEALYEAKRAGRNRIEMAESCRRLPKQ